MRRVAAMVSGEDVEYWEEYYVSEKDPHLDPNRYRSSRRIGRSGQQRRCCRSKSSPQRRPSQLGVSRRWLLTRPTDGGTTRASSCAPHCEDAGVRCPPLHASPFAHSYYRRYGWELATEAISYELKPSGLPTSPEQKRGRAYQDADLPRMMTLLEENASRHSRFTHSDKGRWQQIFARGEQEAAVYDT